MDVVIRVAEPKDVSALYQVETSVFGESVYPDFFFRQAIELWPRLVVVAEDSQQGVVGYILAATAERNDQLWIMSLAVLANFRKRGLARQLLAEVIDSACQKGVTEISLTVHPDNPAMALYESFGFEKQQKSVDYFGQQQPRFRMTLSNPLKEVME